MYNKKFEKLLIIKLILIQPIWKAALELLWEYSAQADVNKRQFYIFTLLSYIQWSGKVSYVSLLAYSRNFLPEKGEHMFNDSRIQDIL